MIGKKEVGKTHKQVGVFSERKLDNGLFLDNWPRIKKRKIVEKLFLSIAERTMSLHIFEERC